MIAQCRLQRSDTSVEELARAVVERKGVPDIIGIFFSFSFISNCSSLNCRLSVLEMVMVVKLESITRFLEMVMAFLK